MINTSNQLNARTVAGGVAPIRPLAEQVPARDLLRENAMGKMFQPLKPVTVTNADDAIKAMQEARRSAKLVNQANIQTINEANAMIDLVNQHIASQAETRNETAQSSSEQTPAHNAASASRFGQFFQRWV